ncbi:toxin TcdB middle/N-terminal domain-containing protein [Microbacterium sp.]|uniref:toxin TcdB middle/N-terminal domain-containing protein n=1 Tax=Microbacterium sp. TaxID=51671 RepID=UPI0025E15CBD|nr:toxin TcdB middle/N-terminal domain-containing protein [Microbacterium sp.]
METSSGTDLHGARGGGGLRGLTDAFQPDLLRGTGNYAVPIDAPAGPGGIRPSLGIRYSTGQGNGPYGMGWQLTGLLTITRGTERGIPSYDDTDDLLLGGDTLVAVGGGRFRPRSDTQFWDVRREGDGWRIRTKDGHAYVLGNAAASRVEDGGRVFAWYCSSEQDAAGNTVSYSYRRDGGQLYLERATWSVFELRLAYADRADAYTTTRPGFPVSTRLRCTHIERHSTRTAPTLTGVHELGYEDAVHSDLSLLTTVRYAGVAADGERTPQVPLTFDYAPFALAPRLVPIASDDGVLPIGSGDAALVDFNGDGLPDVMQTGVTGHRWWRNRGGGQFDAARRIAQAPSGMRLGAPGVTFADLDGDGSADLISIGSRLQKVARNLGDGSWSDDPQVLAGQISLSVSATDSRFVDLDGDGITDLLQTGPHGFTLFLADGDRSWAEPTFVRRRGGVDFPDVSLGDTAVFVADFAGDGMRTIGEIRSGYVRYWPHLGSGRFAPVVEMQHPPHFPSHFQEKNLFVTDFDGDGTSDLLYVDGDRLLLWLNRAGVSWSEPIEIPYAPAPDAASLELVDLLGTGTPGLLWRRIGSPALRMLELATGKPYLLTSVSNGNGAQTQIHYATTSQSRIGETGADDWGTYLPFPVHVVSRLIDRDLITGEAAETRFGYARGCFDPAARIFRGFEHVDVTRVGDGSTPTTVRRTLFHLGDTGGPAGVRTTDVSSQTRLHALAGSMIGVDVFVEDSAGLRHPVESTRFEWQARDEFTDDQGVRVCFPHPVSATAIEVSDGGRNRIEATSYAYDEFGNIVSKRRQLSFEGDATPLTTVQSIAYAIDAATWRVGLPARLTTRDGAGRMLADERLRYDGAPLVGLPEGTVGRGLLTRRLELAILADSLPAGYAAHIAPDWGLQRIGEDWYRTVEAVERDSAGNVVAQDDSATGRTTIQYDADGIFPVRSVDGLGRASTAAFDPRTAQPVTLTTPEGLRTRYEYDTIGRLVAQFDTTDDGSEALTTFVIHRDHNPSTPATPPCTIRILPSEPGADPAVLAAADPASLTGMLVEFAYTDGHGELLQRSAPAAAQGGGWVLGGRARRVPGARAAEEFPNELAPTPEVRPAPVGGASVRFTYDALGRVTRLDHPDGGRFRVSYQGDRILKWDAETADDGDPAVERFDPNGALIAVESLLDGEVVATHYALDHAGRILSITDAEGSTPTTYTYAGPGPAIHIADTTAGERTYWRDAAGRVRRRADARGQVLEYSFDAAGRQMSVTDVSDPLHPLVIRETVYDGASVDRQIEAGVETRYAYDRLGRPLEKSITSAPGEAPLTLRREFGLRGDVRATIYPDGERVEHGYHADGSPRSLAGIVQSVDYDMHGLPAHVDFGGGVTAEYTHTVDLKRLVGVSLRHGGASLRGQQYTYDRNGLIVAVEDSVAAPGGGAPEVTGHRYRYDPLLRLVEWRTFTGGLGGAEASTVPYRYNRRGDLLESAEMGATRFEADPVGDRAIAHVIRAEGISHIDRDGLGKAIEVGAAHDIRYDAWDRIERMVLSDGTILTFAYDASDQRVRREVTRPDGSTETTRWIDGAYETGSSGSRTSYAVGTLVVAVRTVSAGGVATLSRVLSDHLGSVICAVDSAGTVELQQAFTPFGLPVNPGVESRYAGGLEAEGGMLQLGARWYSPVLGRFITPDWFVLENPEHARRLPQALNLYSYSINNPIMLRDPSGKFFGLDDLIVAGIGFVVGFVTGVIVGIAEGRSFGDTLLLGLEAGLLGAIGAWLAYATVGIATAALGYVGLGVGSGLATGLAVGAAVAGGLNGVISGATEIYAWDSWTGYAAFLADSTWGIAGTTLGVLVHTVNLFYGGDRNYQSQLSKRQNRHVYDGGFGFGSFAFTQGNVISNLQGRHGDLLDHESLHILQNRIFGPVFTATYVGWMVAGAVVGFLIGLGLWAAGKQGLGTSINDMAYVNNPWESWAYHVGGGTERGALAW